MVDDIVTRLRAVFHNDKSVELMNREAADEIERLREERDEARRIACENEAGYNGMMFDNPKYSDPIEVMRERGWDCFREEPEHGVEEPPRYDNLQDLG